MTTVLRLLFAFSCLSLSSNYAHANMCEALTKESKEYAAKNSELIRAMHSYYSSDPVILGHQASKIDNVCSYKVFMELLKKKKDWQTYVFTSALDVKTTEAQDSFLDLITKYTFRPWHTSIYRCASRINSQEKANLFKQMIERVEKSAIPFDTLADINDEVQLKAFALIIQKNSSNWQNAVYEAVKSLKSTKPNPNFAFMGFKALLDSVQYKDWPAETYLSLKLVTTKKDYDEFRRKTGMKPISLESLQKEFPDFFQEQPSVKANEPKLKSSKSVKTAEPSPSVEPTEVFKTPESIFDNERLEALIKDNKIGSIEELLPKLPQSLKSNYTLMFHSRSNQQASFQKPRAIMSTPLADFIATFNDASMPGGNILETISVNKKTFEFEFREIVFKDGKVNFSQINPPKCAGCHHGQDDLKPNWDEYDFWFGAYGMHNDLINSKVFTPGGKIGFLMTDEDKARAAKNLEKIGGILALKNTFEEYKAFRANKDKHPRYRYLNDDKTSKYLKYPPYSEKDQGTIDKDREIGEPNLFLNEFIGAWNVQRIFRKLQKSPKYQNPYTKVSLLYYLARCNNDSANTRKFLRTGFWDKKNLKGRIYGNLFIDDLGVDYLKMTDLTFDRDFMLTNDDGFINTDFRLAYLLAEDLKKDLPKEYISNFAEYIKATTPPESRFMRLNSIVPELETTRSNWKGCEVLEKFR